MGALASRGTHYNSKPILLRDLEVLSQAGLETRGLVLFDSVGFGGFVERLVHKGQKGLGLVEFLGDDGPFEFLDQPLVLILARHIADPSGLGLSQGLLG